MRSAAAFREEHQHPEWVQRETQKLRARGLMLSASATCVVDLDPDDDVAVAYCRVCGVEEEVVA